jgi:hypothetical protein|tara:strand:- start:10181 stop:10537 length:357 start_codon:yes stop_codon:yes gene_type:complete
MTQVTKISKKVRTSLDKTLKYQILTHCFFNDVQISSADLDCLALLAVLGEHELTDFCKIAVTNKIFKSPQSARNAVTKAEKKGLLKKNGTNKKTIFIAKELKVQAKNVVLLDYKVLGE